MNSYEYSVISNLVNCLEKSASGVNCEIRSAMQQSASVIVNTGQFYDIKSILKEYEIEQKELSK